jgi:hypothetical protein
MRFVFVILASLFLPGLFAQSPVQSPEAFLGYAPGDRFTRHHRVVEYFRHVDAALENVTLTQYGETYEKRPLIYAVVSSAENMRNIEAIRTDNLKRTGLMEGAPAGPKVAMVWLSYNVHGNEASGMEAAMKTLYELVNPANANTAAWLKNTVVIIDPCLNPDGRDRYANFYNQYGNLPANADPQAREHREPWPGGRSNHYLFDLNRDWAWLTQTESQARVEAYHHWMPHVHVDFHEQGYNNPYYFAPAVEPYHEVITPWQRELQHLIGKNNAAYFDAQGWLYFTKERFDLYYPSYGDTYPTYSGAIGMTYEKAGSRGLAITTREGDPLTLKDRVLHHHTAGLSTIEVASKNAARVVDEFQKFFRDQLSNPTAPYKTYIIKADNPADKLNKLARWFAAHRIRYGAAGAARTTRGFDFGTQATGTVNIGADDWVISIAQPKGKFVTTVFEPQSKLTDSLTYDITAWNLFYAYGLRAFALPEALKPAREPAPKAAAANPNPVQTPPYAYLFRYQSLQDVAFLGALLQAGIKVRSNKNTFTLGNQAFEPGTLIVTRRNNEEAPDFDNRVQQLAAAHNRTFTPATTGFVDRGQDIGSPDVVFLKTPKVALLGGDQTSSLSHGEAWHFFEQEIKYPVTVIGTDYLRDVDLRKYNVLIVPDGNYRVFDESILENIARWVTDGGKLILIGRANQAFADKKGFALKRHANEEEKKKAERAEEAAQAKDALVRYADAERQELMESIFGAIYKTSVDQTHPLVFGLSGPYYTLRTGNMLFPFLHGGWNVGTLRGKQKPLIGFAGYRINQKLENTLAFGVEDKGRGQVLFFIDNPLFRMFWENGKMLMGNAVFMSDNQ